MSLHKLTAGYGYDYLTRQVAALDATEKGHTGFGVLLHRTGGGSRLRMWCLIRSALAVAELARDVGDLLVVVLVGEPSALSRSSVTAWRTSWLWP